MKSKKFISFLCAIIVILSLAGCKIHNNKSTFSSSNNFIVHYINVGQGDSILIQVNNKNMLIDSGPKENKKDLFDYLDSLNIKKIDYLIATHPHEDHIGNMAKIIKSYDIGAFYAPKIESSTKTFEQMIDALKSKDLKINIIKSNIQSIDLGENTIVSFFSPNKDNYDNLNNYSPVMKIQYGKNKFLFVGDAEKDVEDEVIKNKYNLKSDVLKVGHHGSSSSSSEEFIKAVNPSIGIISCGIDNKYNHPNESTLNILEKYNVKIYRTDKDGTIVLSSDGENIYKEN